MFEVDSISRSVSLREEGHTISDNSFREDTTYETNACPLVSDFFKITNYEQKGKKSKHVYQNVKCFVYMKFMCGDYLCFI